MGFWDFLRSTQAAPSQEVAPSIGGDASYSWMSPNVEYLGGPEWAERVADEWSKVRSMSAAQMWREQPHLRTVVSFMARNVAQLGLHTFERVSETDRRRDRRSPIAQALADPGDGMTTYDLVFAVVGDKALYDRAYWLPWVDDTGAWRLRRLPPSWVSAKKRNAFAIETYSVSFNGSTVEVPADRIVAFSGYSPTHATGCSPTIESLKQTMGEQIEASRYRAQVFKRGGRASAVLTRPADAPKWSDGAAERFREDWYARYTGDGSHAGGTPILEDGMRLERIDFSATDQQWVEGMKLAFATVASAFHINPTMVGILDNANYSNVREFRRMLYGDSLGPILTEIEAVLNTFALPTLGMDKNKFYVEFNIAEKLQGSFEEQTAAMSSAIGRPWMTADEGRARLNMPALGGDAERLVTPLNVLVGGQASPRDSGSQNRNHAPSRHVKARAPQTFEDKAAEVVGGFFARQERVIRTALGAKAAEDWWDEERWDSELSDDLYRLAVSVAGEVASSTLKDIGFSPDEYDEDRTLAWLLEVSARSASSINATTKARIDAALGADVEDGALDSVFGGQSSRASQIAVSTVTLISSFASCEAAGQVSRGATKTWVTGSNPRADHAALDGETVPLSEDFSNGAAWPGDGANLGADDLAGCNCSLAINVP